MSTTKTQRVHMWSDNDQLQKPTATDYNSSLHIIMIC